MKKHFVTCFLLLLTYSFCNAQIVTTIAGCLKQGSANGIGTAATFWDPTGLVCDANGNLFVTDQENEEIRMIRISNDSVTTFAGSTTPSLVNGIGTAARFYSPTEITTDGKGNLYIADQTNDVIRKIVISTGAVTTLASGFNCPQGIVYDGTGNLYVADACNNEIRKVDISTGIVTTIAGSTARGCVNGIGTAAKFNTPSGVTIDTNGNLYVADRDNNEIRKIVISTAAVSILAGDTLPGSVDGTGTAASFKGPVGVVTDGKGNVYVGDADNNEIRRIVISTGVVTTLAGSTTPGSANGADTSASFNLPEGLAIDRSGNLYVGDAWNNEIRLITVTPSAISTIPSISMAISLYPNPTNQTLYVEFSQILSGEMTIIDITGRELLTQNVDKLQNSLSMDVSSLLAGIYFIRMENSDGNTITKKFVKQ